MQSSGKSTRPAGQRLLFLAVIILLLGALVPAASASAAQDVPRFEPAACSYELPEGFVEGENIECGYLVVPEEHENPGGPTIELGVAILRSADSNPAPDPLVMLQGGPGGSAIDTYLSILPDSSLLTNRDIILLDQRGTLHADPFLDCPEYLEMSIELLNTDLPEEELNQRAFDAIAACHDRLSADGVDLSAYDSLENAADVAALAPALGYDQINLYGVSYGTLLALHVMREYPDQLRSVILDAVVPPQTNFIVRAPQTQNRSFEAMFAACAADDACSRAFPNLRQVFYDTADQLNANPATVRVFDPETFQQYDALMDGDTFISLVFQMMYVTELIPLMPRIIYNASAGDYALLTNIYSVLIFDRTMSYGMYYSVLCAEDADFTVDEYDLEGLPDQIVAMEVDSPQFFLDVCQIWNVDPLGPAVDAPVVSDVPTLLLSGYFDPITPPDYAAEAAQTLSNSYSYVVPWGGHGAAGSGPCQDSIVNAFLADPNSPPDSAAACLQQESLEFTTPDNLVRLPILPKLLNLEGGTGWQALLFGLGLLFLLTALGVYPLVWLVRLFSGNKPQPQTPVGQPYYGAETGAGDPYAASPKGLYRFAPWLASLNALLLLVFTAVFIGVLVNMVNSNDWRTLLGLPGSARPLFLLPLAAALLTLLMLVAALTGWGRKSGSAWGKVYFTLLTVAAGVCVAVLGVWGLLTAFF